MAQEALQVEGIEASGITWPIVAWRFVGVAEAVGGGFSHLGFDVCFVRHIVEIDGGQFNVPRAAAHVAERTKRRPKNISKGSGKRKTKMRGAKQTEGG